MPETELGYKHTLHLETVTPVAVGNGGTLSPSADYTLDPQNKQCALLLDHKMFEAWLTQNPAALTDYLNAVKKNAGNNRNTFLYQFLSKYHNQKEAKSYFNAERMIVGYAHTVELKTCLKDAGRPFIPGSTLKGAFKSVWLHNWLSANPVKVNDVIRSINGTRNEKEARKEIEKVIVECLDNLPSQDKRMQFSTLQISDAYINGDLKWYHTKRFKLSKDGKTVVPLFLEAIAPSAEGSFSVMVENNNLVQTNHGWIKSLETGSLVPFFAQVNQYALDNIEHELEMTQSEELWDYKKFLRDRKNDIENSKNQSAWLPIGFGKSNFYQSIGLFIRRRDKGAFEKYIKLFKMGKKPNAGETDQKELPLTRNLSIEGHLPLGWIKLYENIHDCSIPKSVKHFNQGDQIEATVATIARPFSKIKIPGVDGLINMSGTKDAQRNPRFKEQAVVVVQIDINKDEKITQARFIRVK
ncbi:MAG: type III-A CRISPR-associated RAMP protein Csm5 [Bacteroidales bacterium]|nr:type III-A CRISPR-associated RAMP protein Csm5 [Bacteroidales bacterium]